MDYAVDYREKAMYNGVNTATLKRLTKKRLSEFIICKIDLKLLFSLFMYNSLLYVG